MPCLNGTHTYAYDDAYRLTGVSYPPGNMLDAEGESYGYDAVGNRTQERVLGSYSHNAGNQLVENSSYTYTYDNNGNLTRKTDKATSEQYNYTYNSHNQLTRVQMPNGVQVDYKYDLFGNRVEKVVSTTTVTTTRYVYSGEDIIGILDGNNTVVSRVLHGPGIDEPLLIVTGNNEAYLYADGLGSIIAVADAGAVLRETIEYGAYGKTVYKDAVTGSTSTVSYTGNPYGYTGREADAETGLYYYRARYYDVETGRFIQADPIGFKGGDTNLYAYVGDNTLSYKDPLGLFQFPADPSGLDLKAWKEFFPVPKEKLKAMNGNRWFRNSENQVIRFDPARAIKRGHGKFMHWHWETDPINPAHAYKPNDAAQIKIPEPSWWKLVPGWIFRIPMILPPVPIIIVPPGFNPSHPIICPTNGANYDA